MVATVQLKLNRIRGDWQYFRYKRLSTSPETLWTSTVDSHSRTACGEPCNEKSDALKQTPTHARLDTRKNMTNNADSLGTGCALPCFLCNLAQPLYLI